MTEAVIGVVANAASGPTIDLGPAPGTRHRIDVDLRWSDLDTLAHVNHAAVVDVLGECRLRWMKGHATTHGASSFSDPLVVASLTVDYSNPARHGEPLTVEMSITRIGNKSFTVLHEAVQAGTACVRATAVVVPLGPTDQPRELTPSERIYLTNYVHLPEGGIDP